MKTKPQTLEREPFIKCEICNKPSLKNLVICSEQCGKVRQKLLDLERKYFPTNGCDNCWGDLHSGCSETCKREFKEALEFGTDLYSIINLVYPERLTNEN